MEFYFKFTGFNLTETVSGWLEPLAKIEWDVGIGMVVAFAFVTAIRIAITRYTAK